VTSRFPHVLLVAYLAFFAVLAIRPYDRTVWFAENLPIVLIVVTLITTYPVWRFSNTAYMLMACLIFLHTLGGHYTFERVPFGFVTDFFGFGRNHFDRLAHFTVGFYAYAAAEILLVKRMVRSPLILYLFPVFMIFTIAGGYEIIEWLYAASADASAGQAVLGSQGDVWDAQKDMLADALGAVSAMLLFHYRNRAEIARLQTHPTGVNRE
jgi:putative membrane protein